MYLHYMTASVTYFFELEHDDQHNHQKKQQRMGVATKRMSIYDLLNVNLAHPTFYENRDETGN